MKKLLAIVIAVVMTFSMTTVFASASDELVNELPVVGVESEFAGVVDGVTDIYDELKGGEYEEALDDTFIFIEDIANLIHEVIGKIMAVLGQDCALCGEFHGEVIEDSELLPVLPDNSDDLTIFR